MQEEDDMAGTPVILVMSAKSYTWCRLAEKLPWNLFPKICGAEVGFYRRIEFFFMGW
jgi:hypothetical protein